MLCAKDKNGATPIGLAELGGTTKYVCIHVMYIGDRGSEYVGGQNIIIGGQNKVRIVIYMEDVGTYKPCQLHLVIETHTDHDNTI